MSCPNPLAVINKPSPRAPLWNTSVANTGTRARHGSANSASAKDIHQRDPRTPSRRMLRTLPESALSGDGRCSGGNPWVRMNHKAMRGATKVAAFSANAGLVPNAAITTPKRARPFLPCTQRSSSYPWRSRDGQPGRSRQGTKGTRVATSQPHSRSAYSLVELDGLEDPAARSNLTQLRALCVRCSGFDVLLPLSGEDLTDQRSPVLILQLGNLLQAVTDLGIERGFPGREGLLPLASWNRVNFRRKRPPLSQGMRLQVSVVCTFGQVYGDDRKRVRAVALG